MRALLSLLGRSAREAPGGAPIVGVVGGTLEGLTASVKKRVVLEFAPSGLTSSRATEAPRAEIDARLGREMVPSLLAEPLVSVGIAAPMLAGTHDVLTVPELVQGPMPGQDGRDGEHALGRIVFPGRASCRCSGGSSARS